MIKQRISGVDGGHENKIVRLVVENLPRAVQADIDFAFIRKVKSEALHFEFQPRQPKMGSFARDGGEPVVGRSLEDEWRDFAMTYQAPGGVEKQELYDMGIKFLKRFDRGEG
jgi:hypothetical protein